MKAIRLVLLLCLAAWTLPAAAQDLTLRHSPRSMQGMRPLAMGGAFIAVDGTDENALFYNPAAISDYPKKVHMQFLWPSIEFSAKAIPYFAATVPNLADDIDDADSDSAKLNRFNTFTNANTGRYEEVGAHGNLAMFMHKFAAVSLFYETRAIMALTNPASSTIDIEAVTQGGLQAGTAGSFFDGLLQLGLAIKFMGRHLVDETVSQREIVANDNFGDSLDLNNLGYGVGLDVGAKGRIPWEWKVWKILDPVFAVTVQDVGHTRFTGDVGRMNESMTAGFALHPDYWKLKSVFALDVRDLDQRTDFITKLHLGYEVVWPDLSKKLHAVSARLGLNQGYVGGGFGLDFKRWKLNLSTWGRETGVRTRQKESRLFGAQLAVGF